MADEGKAPGDDYSQRAYGPSDTSQSFLTVHEGEALFLLHCGEKCAIILVTRRGRQIAVLRTLLEVFP